MVIAIDAVQCSAQAETTEHWQTKFADYVFSDEPKQDRSIMAPARGIFCGLLLSGALWVGLVAAARMVLTAMR